TLREGSDPAVVTVVERDSPAWKAGVVSGDTLVALNGLRVSSKDIGDRMALSTSAPFKLHLFRRDELIEKQITPLQQPKGKLKIKTADKANEAQKALNAAWLGMAWPKDDAAKAAPATAKKP